ANFDGDSTIPCPRIPSVSQKVRCHFVAGVTAIPWSDHRRPEAIQPCRRSSNNPLETHSGLSRRAAQDRCSYVVVPRTSRRGNGGIPQGRYCAACGDESAL